MRYKREFWFIIGTIYFTVILLLAFSMLIQGCELEPEIPPEETIHYLTSSEYTQLLNTLSGQTINKSVIDTELSSMGVSLSYDSGYYESGNYKDYSMNWSYYSDGSWVYYVDVDIWSKDDILYPSMCNYYSD